MKNEDLERLSMTELETALRTVFALRPDIQDKILTSQELTEYITWMAENFGRQIDLTIDSLSSFVKTRDISDLANRILADPQDHEALRKLAAGYKQQSEERYITGGHDISVGRMFRYMPAHWHTNTYFEVYYSFSGICPVHFPDEVILLKPGAVLIVAPDVVHASPCYSDDCCLIYCMARSSTFEQVFWSQLPQDSLMSTFFRRALDGGRSTAYVQFETGADRDVRRLMLDIYREYQTGEIYSAQMLNALMSAFFIMMLRRYEGTARMPRTEDFFWKHEFSAIFTFIQSNYTHTSLSEIAERFHYSERQISRIVQDNTGKNYAQLIKRLRMEKAATLLREQKLSVQDISAMVGYSTLSSFYRTFAQYYGCTPGAYSETTGVQKK